MLKTGIALLTVSSLGVLSRSADLAFSAGPYIKFLCLSGLSISFVCFIATYCKVEHPRFCKRVARPAQMIKSSAWKHASAA